MARGKPQTHIERVERAAGNESLSDNGVDAPLYNRIFLGAQRDWPNDEIGWTRIPHTKMVGQGEDRRIVRVKRRDINRLERRVAGWNLNLD